MEAEDAMQDAFFKAFDKISTFRNNVTFGAWLKRIVVNTCIDYLKKCKVDFLSIDEVQGVAEPQVVEDIVPNTVEEVKRAMGLLPNGYRLVLNLHLVEGFDYPEIAEIIGTSQSNVRSQFARAKRKLVEMMKQDRINNAAI